MADVELELPIGFELAAANESERYESFVADRGLDSNRLRKRLFEADILAVIDNRNLWQDNNLDPDQLKVPTRCLDKDKIDTLLRTEHGDLYCKCPQSQEIRLTHYQGYEKKRGTLKWAYPAAVNDLDCKGQDECYRLGNVRAGSSSGLRTVF